MVRHLARMILLAALAFASAPAMAHPHVWVSVATTVIYEHGSVKAFRHRWVFDESYTSMAIENLDANNDGKIDRSELAELAKVNIDGLKEFEYFTAAKLGEQPLAFGAPTDYWMELTEIASTSMTNPMADPAATENKKASGAQPKVKVLVLEFTLPLQQPVLAEADGFKFSVADPSFFIWFDFVKKEPVKLASAPAGCKAKISGAVDGGGQSLGDAAATPGINWGVAKTVSLSCHH